jgi:glycosyltransferase involved in cell wall biosynthesis
MTRLSPHPHVVVFIDVAGDFGGAETLAVQLLERLDPERFRRTLVAYAEIEPGPLHDATVNVVARLRAAGIDVLELNRRDRLDLPSWRPFLRLLRSGDVDVLHAHKFGPNLWATSFARLADVPVVLAHEHTWSFEGGPTRRLLDRWAIATGCDAFLAVSEQDRERMVAVERIPPARVRFLPNGIPAPPPIPGDGGEGVRAELGVPAGAPLVGAVGIFRPQKDFSTLVHAHVALLERHPDAHLVIVGHGPQEAQIAALVERLGVRERVRLPGARADVPRLVAAFDVAVNSSLFEGSSLAILEYMALGRPIVATAVGGTPDLLGHGEAGVLVAPADPAALAAAIGRLLADPAGAAALGARARARQREHYDIDEQAQRVQAIYDELLAAAAATRWRRVLHRIRGGRRAAPDRARPQ